MFGIKMSFERAQGVKLLITNRTGVFGNCLGGTSGSSGNSAGSTGCGFGNGTGSARCSGSNRLGNFNLFATGRKEEC